MKHLVVFTLLALPQATLACATCSGPADAPQSHGMNAAILTLFCVLGVVGLTILGFAGAVAWRIAAHQASEPAQTVHQAQPLAVAES